VRGYLATVPLFAVLLATGCAATAESNAAQKPPTAAASTSSDDTPPERMAARVLRLQQMPSGLRPDCRDGRVNRVIPGYAGWGQWGSPEKATASLLQHPGADHASWSPAASERVTVVLYRGDGTTKATARLRRVNDQWLPDSIALCRSNLS
jgi:hypothetical protein